MKHFPIFINLVDQPVVVSGAGETALAKLRLLLKTEANITVYGASPVAQIKTYADDGKITLIQKPLSPSDLKEARLTYAANDNAQLDGQIAQWARAAGSLVNIVDNLGGSDFITPAIVDRDPVTVAIGTEGTAPVLARQIKSQIEEALPVSLGVLARLAQSKRAAVEILPFGRARREFWSEFFFTRGPAALARQGKAGARRMLDKLLIEKDSGIQKPARFDLVGAGTGDPELLTMKARKALHEADVVFHELNVPKNILELARREAILVPAKRFNSHQKTALKAAFENGEHAIWLQLGNPTSLDSIGVKQSDLQNVTVETSIIPGVPVAGDASQNLFGSSIAKQPFSAPSLPHSFSTYTHTELEHV